MDWSLTVISKGGRKWRIVGDPRCPVRLKRGSLSGLIGSRSDELFQLVGRDGVRRHRGAVAGQLVGQMTVVVRSLDGGAKAGDVLADWMADWRQPVKLEFSGGGKTFHLPAQLADGFSPEPWGLEPEKAADRFPVNGFIEVPWSMASDAGLWKQSVVSVAEAAGSTVVVTNYGDGVVIPVLEWDQAGQVVAPGGAVFNLSSVSGRRRMLLDVAENYLVTDAAGVVDRDVWSALRGAVFATAVPPGRSETWQIPAGSSLAWEIGVRNPWA